MVVERRVGTVRGHDRIAGADQKPHEVSQKPVDAFADHDAPRINAVVGRQRGPQVMAFGVAVFPHLRRRPGHRRDGAGRGAEDAFVGPDPRGEGASARALLRLGAHEGHRGGQAFSQGSEAGAGHGVDRQATSASRSSADLSCASSSSLAARSSRVSSTTSSGALSTNFGFDSRPRRPPSSFRSFSRPWTAGPSRRRCRSVLQAGCRRSRPRSPRSACPWAWCRWRSGFRSGPGG